MRIKKEFMKKSTILFLLLAIITSNLIFAFNSVNVLAEENENTSEETSNEETIEGNNDAATQEEESSNNSDNEGNVMELDPNIGGEPAPKEEVDLSKLKKIADNNEAALYLDSTNLNLYMELKSSGKVHSLKVMNGNSGNEYVSNVQKSDIVFTYLSDVRRGLSSSVENYSLAIANEQFEIEEIEDGIKIKYTLGSETRSITDLPKQVESQKMYDKVISKLSKEQEKEFLTQYRLFKGSYIRMKDDKVSQLMIDRIYSYLYEIGEYTTEDLIEDSNTYGFEVEAASLSIQASIEYKLEGKDLVVKMPIDELEITGDDTVISTVNMLPYLMSAERDQEEGYMFVPDGSGAVINFDNNKQSAPDFKSSIYGEDILKNAKKYKNNRIQTTLPVAGIKYKDYAVLAIVEEGAEIAEVNANISGKLDAYNKVGVNFKLFEVDQVESVGAANVSISRFSKDFYDKDIQMRYKFIEEDEAQSEEVSYVDMALTYKNYLQSNDMLSGIIDEQIPSLDVEFLGSIRKRQFFIGIPYNTNVALTKFEEMDRIIAELVDAGVSDLNVEISGFANKGLDHTAMNKMSVLGVMGGETKLNQLLNKYNNNDTVELYPAMFLSQAFTKNNLNQYSDIARHLSGEQARVAKNNHVREMSRIGSGAPYLISPSSYKSYLGSVLNQLKRLQSDNLSTFDLGNRIVGDYNTNNDISRTSALKYIEESLKYLSDNKNSLMLANPNAYALKFADKITDVPIDDNNLEVVDYDIPFLQIVLDGSVKYYGNVLNSNIWENPEFTLLRLIEYKTNPKFQISAADSEMFKDTDYEALMNTNYDIVGPKAVELYQKYSEAYESIANSRIIEHKVIEANLRKVSYDNGINVYLNYGNEDKVIDGVKIAPLSYEIVKK